MEKDKYPGKLFKGSHNFMGNSRKNKLISVNTNMSDTVAPAGRMILK